jgi:hypothetical protein
VLLRGGASSIARVVERLNRWMDEQIKHVMIYFDMVVVVVVEYMC